MCLVRTLLSRTAIAYRGLHANKIRRGIICCRCIQCGCDLFKIIAVINVKCLKAEGFCSLRDILTERNIGISFDGNRIGIIENRQLRKVPGSCKRKCLGGNAFHEITISGNHIGSVIDHRIARLVKD